jgi:hypothetical protein
MRQNPGLGEVYGLRKERRNDVTRVTLARGALRIIAAQLVFAREAYPYASLFLFPED